MYASIKKFAVRGFIAINILLIALGIFVAAGIIPSGIPEIDWIKADNPEIAMWALFSPIVIIYLPFVLVMGFELSNRAGRPLGLSKHP